MIDGIVFSKDRPMQTDLLLQSLRRNCGGLFGRVHIIYKASSSDFDRGYRLLGERWAGFANLVAETSFRDDVLCLLSGPPGDLIATFVDDCICFRDVTGHLGTVERALSDPAVASFILGMGRECVYSGTLNQWFAQPPLQERDGVLSWRWKNSEAEFGCPFMFIGNVHRKLDYLRWAGQVPFGNPSHMEENLQRTWQSERQAEMPDLCASFPSQVAVLSHNNRVQNVCCNRFGEKFPHTAESLNSLYLSGEVVDLDALDFSGVNGVHTEVEFAFKKA